MERVSETRTTSFCTGKYPRQPLQLPAQSVVVQQELLNRNFSATGSEPRASTQEAVGRWQGINQSKKSCTGPVLQPLQFIVQNFRLDIYIDF